MTAPSTLTRGPCARCGGERDVEATPLPGGAGAWTWCLHCGHLTFWRPPVRLRIFEILTDLFAYREASA